MIMILEHVFPLLFISKMLASPSRGGYKDFGPANQSLVGACGQSWIMHHLGTEVHDPRLLVLNILIGKNEKGKLLFVKRNFAPINEKCYALPKIDII